MNVSIVIPCYNAEAYLAQAIGSALAQHHPPCEVIVVDDGSTDGSLAVARRFAAACGGRVKVLSERSGQAARTRNLGADVATGDALMFLDADDVLGPDVLGALTAVLQRHPGGIAMSPWYRLDLDGERWVKGPASCKPRQPGQDTLSAWLTGWYHPPCSVLWSRAAFERAGRWDERWNPNDDGDLMMRALAYGIPVVETESGASFYRRMPEGEGSLSGARFTCDGLEERLRTVQKIISLLEERDRLRPYRAALRTSFRRVAADAEEHHPDLHARALSLAQTYAPPAWERASARATTLLRRVGKRVYNPLRRRLGAVLGAGQRPAEAANVGAVRYGLDRAAQVLAHAPTADAPLQQLDPPLVSVIIPTYNRAHVLPRALDSALAQTFEDFEVLVVDDGSADDTEAVVTGYGDARVRYLRQPTNQGVSAARNRGLREARGTFIAFLDSDDVWFPHKLEAQVQRFRQLSGDVGLLYGGVEDDYGDGEREIRTPIHRGDLYPVLLATNVIHGTSGVMIRRNVVATVGFFDEEIPAIEDYDYWLRIARFFKGDFIEEPLIRYHDPKGIKRKSLDVRDNIDARDYLFEKHLGQMRAEGTAYPYLRKSIGRVLRVDPENRQLARKLVRRALRYRPLSYEMYRKLVALTLPPRLFQGLRTALTPVRRLGKAAADGS